MFRKIALLAPLVALVFGVTAPSPQAATPFDPLTQVNNVTFSQAAALPGITLAPGRYTFEAGPARTNSNIVRVTRNRQTIFLGLTVPTSRAKDSEPSIVTFGEAARGEAVPILAWYPGGSNQGHQFLYR